VISWRKKKKTTDGRAVETRTKVEGNQFYKKNLINHAKSGRPSSRWSMRVVSAGRGARASAPAGVPEQEKRARQRDNVGKKPLI